MTQSADKPRLKDMKEGLSSARKPDITHVRTPFKVYTTRPCEYGSFKYVRANFMRPVSPSGYTGTPTREDFERFRSYVRASIAHASQALDAMELHQATDPDLLDVEGMRAAAYAADTDEDTTGKIGPSFLPHIAPACSSLNMAITQAVLCGLLPADPGQPWIDKACASPAAASARKAWRDAGGLNPITNEERARRDDIVNLVGRQNMPSDVDLRAIINEREKLHAKLHAKLDEMSRVCNPPGVVGAGLHRTTSDADFRVILKEEIAYAAAGPDAEWPPGVRL